MELIEHYTKRDEDFDNIYPAHLKEMSKTHWTPVLVIERAVNWLESEQPVRILDIGSGVGKFCIIGSKMSTSTFVGVEKRKNLFLRSKKTASLLEAPRVEFINDNITNINFQNFDAFYYFNPFGEQIAISNWIDQKPNFSEEKFERYEEYVIQQLAKMPIGTKVVTYYSFDFILPNSYSIAKMINNGALVFWIKIR